MAVRRILCRGPQAIALLRWPEPHTLENCLEFCDTSAAVDFLRPYLDDPISLTTLREVLATEGAYTDITGLEAQDVLAELALYLVWGRVKVVPYATSRAPIQAGIAGQAAAQQ